jgi:hypothetical protein
LVEARVISVFRFKTGAIFVCLLILVFFCNGQIF